MVNNYHPFILTPAKLTPHFNTGSFHNISIRALAVLPIGMPPSAEFLVSPQRLTRFVAKIFLLFDALIYFGVR
jgi:hypothetical protein